MVIIDIAKLNKINPYIIAVRYFDGTKHDGNKEFPIRNVYDYELEYIVEGNGKMIIDGREYPAVPGTLFCRRPHQKNQGIMPYKCYLIPFDIWGNYNNTIDQFTVRQKSYQPLMGNDGLPPEISRIFYMDRMEEIFRAIYNEYLQDKPLKQLMLRSYFYHILNEVFEASFNKSDKEISMPVTLQQKIKRCINFINDNYKENISIDTLSEIAGLSASHFHRVFKVITGQSPVQFILSKRLMEAKRLLTQTSLSVKEICYECGFDNQSYFSRTFKQKNNMTPIDFRKNHMINF